MQKIVESLKAIIDENKKIDDTTLYVENKSQDHTSASCISDSTNDMPSDDVRLCLSQSMEENECNSDIINRVENMSILSNNIENTKTWTSRKGICTSRNNKKQKRMNNF
ncbi:unnamed protein product [Rhizophagus irregularis]|uniref:Uncharacterized protein n=1 Tax=Rhizophagus irregularis TaxID=588596 RepID=A0A915Z2U4_9GLOM|nr:unnamed protein product [Rhizophagus irregularis]CAB5181731.1 unnamed protein product [Rhizophagus irregularis]CAB5360366.1 unnamed protein product [Rhizophagus irregularis]